jgi:hypothetical protein
MIGCVMKKTEMRKQNVTSGKQEKVMHRRSVNVRDKV